MKKKGKSKSLIALLSHAHGELIFFFFLYIGDKCANNVSDARQTSRT